MILAVYLLLSFNVCYVELTLFTVLIIITYLDFYGKNNEQKNDLVRSHWYIENKVHWMRDVIYDEDRSQVRCGNTPQVIRLNNTEFHGIFSFSLFTIIHF